MNAFQSIGPEGLRLVRSEVDRACSLLREPSLESLDSCAWLLQSACDDLARLRSAAQSSGSSAIAAAEASRLREAVRRTACSLGVAREYHFLWMGDWSRLNSNYTPAGEPPQLPQRGLVTLTG